MAGKRLVDVAALFNAARGVAQKHIALRSNQIDVYNRTSTLAKAVRNQTDRVTETARAASVLFSRLNEDAPAWAADIPENASRNQAHNESPIPSRSSVARGSTGSEMKEGIGQDHFYERSPSNSTMDEVPRRDLEVTQKKADNRPLPDGTIPPKDAPLRTTQGVSSSPGNMAPNSEEASQNGSEQEIPSHTADALDNFPPDPLEQGHDEVEFYRRPEHTSSTHSSLPKVQIPEHMSSTQRSDEHLPNLGLNSDTFYSAEESEESEKIPSVQAVPEQEQVPEGINTDLFHSPKVAKILGGKLQGGKKPELDLKGVKGTPVDHTSLGQGKVQDTFNVRTSAQSRPTSTATIVEDDEAGPSSANEALPEQFAKGIIQDTKDVSASKLDLQAQMLNSDSDLGAV